MASLTQAQKDTFWRDGVIVIENAVDQVQLSQLRAEFERWVEDSRGQADDLPSQFTHELVRGTESGRVRCSNYDMALPAVPKATSFFAQQEGADG